MILKWFNYIIYTISRNMGCIILCIMCSLFSSCHYLLLNLVLLKCFLLLLACYVCFFVCNFIKNNYNCSVEVRGSCFHHTAWKVSKRGIFSGPYLVTFYVVSIHLETIFIIIIFIIIIIIIISLLTIQFGREGLLGFWKYINSLVRLFKL